MSDGLYVREVHIRVSCGCCAQKMSWTGKTTDFMVVWLHMNCCPEHTDREMNIKIKKDYVE